LRHLCLLPQACVLSLNQIILFSHQPALFLELPVLQLEDNQFFLQLFLYVLVYEHLPVKSFVHVDYLKLGQLQVLIELCDVLLLQALVLLEAYY